MSHCLQEIGYTGIIYRVQVHGTSYSAAKLIAAISSFLSILPTSINDELFRLFVGDRSMDDIIGAKKTN